MGKKNSQQQQEEEVKTLAEVEEALIEKNEELISEENITSMEAPQEQKSLEEVKEAFEKTDMQEDNIEDGLEHITPEEAQETVIEPIKELLEEAKDIQEDNEEILGSMEVSSQEEAEEVEKALENQISKVESFKKKLQESFKGKTNYQIIHSWNGANYPF